MQISFKFLAVALVLAGASALCVPALAAPGTTATASNFDPVALKLFDQAVASYAALDGLSLDFVTTQQVNGEPSQIVASGNWTFLRPDKFRLEVTKGDHTRLFLSDGSTFIGQTGDATFQRSPLAKPMMPQSAGAIPGAAGLLLPLMVTGEDSRSPFFAVDWSRAQLWTVPGFDALDMTKRSPNDAPGSILRIYLDPKTHLVARVESEKTLNSQNTPQQTVANKLSVTTFAPRTTKVVPALFEFKAPPGATLTELKEEPVAAQERFAVGDKPLEFREKTLDGKALSLDSYKGKVVLLDFWATWCGPCVAELPTIQECYKKYRAQGFEIVGISLDEDKDALTNFIKAKDMSWPQIFDGKGWEAGDAKTYGVQAIPFTLLIGKDGKIAAVNPRGEELEPALQAALAK